MGYRRFRRTLRLSALTAVDVDTEQPDPGVDRLSNAICLEAVDLDAMLNGDLQGELPVSDRLLGLFLHETTHHASFSNAFGAVVSALTTSASWLGGPIMHPEPASGSLSLPSRDGLMLKWMEELYNPLLEGTALFAQYDLLSGEYHITSHCLVHAVSLFFSISAGQAALQAFEHALESQQPYQAALIAAEGAHDAFVNSRIRLSRLNDDTLDQKVNLLCQPLVPAAGGTPYLLGYLATKRAYAQVRKSFSPIGDTDLFLMTMLHFWFSDVKVAEIGARIDDHHAELIQGSLGELTEHFQDRWETLFKSPKQAVLAAVAAIDSQSTGGWLPDQWLDMQLGIRTAGFAINMFAPKLHKHRLTIRHGATPVDLYVNEAFAEIRDICDGTLLYRAPVCADGDRGGFAGSVELVRSHEGLLAAVVVLGPTGLLAVRNIVDGSWNDPTLVAAFDDLPSLDHVRAAAAKVEEEIWRSEFTEGNMLAMYEFQIEQALALRNAVHLQIALPGLAEPEQRRAVRLLANDGFEAVFPEHIQEVAKFSLAFGGGGALATDLADYLDISPEGILARVKEFNRIALDRLGIELFEVASDRITALL